MSCGYSGVEEAVQRVERVPEKSTKEKCLPLAPEFRAGK
jgi:hypothetical protein